MRNKRQQSLARIVAAQTEKRCGQNFVFYSIAAAAAQCANPRKYRGFCVAPFTFDERNFIFEIALAAFELALRRPLNHGVGARRHFKFGAPVCR